MPFDIPTRATDERTLPTRFNRSLRERSLFVSYLFLSTRTLAFTLVVCGERVISKQGIFYLSSVNPSMASLNWKFRQEWGTIQSDSISFKDRDE